MAQQQRSNALKFGNWESEEDVPYTAYFDKARKVKTPGGNPKDTEENPGLYADYGAPSQSIPPKPKSDSEAPAGRRPSRQGREGMKSREDSDFKQFMQSPARHGGNHGRSHNEAGDKQASRSYGNSKNNSYETSPLHHQAKVSGRVVGARSPFSDGNKGSYDGGSARRSRPRTNSRGDESPDESAAVPKFGDWNENDPSSADGYTHIFNRVREERNNAGTPRTPSHPNTRNQQPPTDSVKCCCFSWGGK